MDEPLLEARHLKKVYLSGQHQRLEVLKDVNLRVHQAEMVAIVGESGTGKSTLLHLLGTLDRPTEGEVRYRGHGSVFNLDDEALARFRNRRIGFIFQFHHLLPEFTALENVAMPALIARRRMAEVRPRAYALLELMGIADRADHLPSQLSGGEQQRVAVARALMNAPEVILADEPTGNLDTRNAEALYDEFARLNQEHGQTFIIVTHNRALAARTHRMLRLADGMLHPETA